MKYTVELRLARDNGWNYESAGLLPTAAYANSTFDPFWSPEGIFHDIFEHWFEGILPRFSGTRMFSIYGEMVASAIKCYFYSRLSVDAFKFRNIRVHRTFREDTEYHLFELAEHDVIEYEPIPLFKTTIPEVDNCYTYPIETVITEYLHVLRERCGYKFMVKHRKQIVSSYRYGWKLAKRMWGHDRSKASDALNNLLDEFNVLCTNDAESLVFPEDISVYGIRSLIAKVDTKAKNICKLVWTDDVRNELPFDSVVSF